MTLKANGNMSLKGIYDYANKRGYSGAVGLWDLDDGNWRPPINENPLSITDFYGRIYLRDYTVIMGVRPVFPHTLNEDAYTEPYLALKVGYTDGTSEIIYAGGFKTEATESFQTGNLVYTNGAISATWTVDPVTGTISLDNDLYPTSNGFVTNDGVSYDIKDRNYDIYWTWDSSKTVDYLAFESDGSTAGVMAQVSSGASTTPVATSVTSQLTTTNYGNYYFDSSTYTWGTLSASSSGFSAQQTTNTHNVTGTGSSFIVNGIIRVDY